MPSWEEIVTDIVICSNYYGIDDAATGWSAIFRHMGTLRDDVDRLAKESKPWKGQAADDFRKHLKKCSDALEDLDTNHRKIVHALEGASEHLSTAVNKIPIPAWMIHKVEDAQAAYAKGMSVPGFSPGSFAQEALAIDGDLVSGIPGVKDLAGWVGGKEDTAQAAYNQLISDYNGDIQAVPAGTKSNPGAVDKDDDYGDTPTGGGGGGHVPPTGTGTPPHTRTPTSPTPKPPHTTDPSTPWKDPSADYPGGDPSGGGAGSGLAGAGGGPLGAGTGGGGLGGGTRGVPPLGPTADPAADAARAGAGGAAGMMGRGMGRGGHGEGEGDEHETWLTEDEDPWGADGDANPSVLGS
ncbi:hypothetical protein [Actinocatenispora rupis]|uniref:Proteins of 100 residues with WXG n=1 Tax=Actinocatenispora rupis TaxID=519421 RepID=A0A8J3JCQ7_9ACTN|nr:hypothetical protein [Actinocatenispora rupis]GID13588.1 hypothetical protein Aru02nite_44770 [Actinocatenispora rupis]